MNDYDSTHSYTFTAQTHMNFNEIFNFLYTKQTSLNFYS